MTYSSSHPKGQVFKYSYSKPLEFVEPEVLFDFAAYFLGYRWVYGLDNFKKLYGLC